MVRYWASICRGQHSTNFIATNQLLAPRPSNCKTNPSVVGWWASCLCDWISSVPVLDCNTAHHGLF